MATKESHDKLLREHVVYLLTGGGAHATFDDAVKGMPEKWRGVRPEGFPHSAWMLLDHLRLTQWDILEFSRNPNYKAPKWPEAYWPGKDEPASATAWEKSIRQFREDRKAIEELVENPKTDLFARIPWGDGQTILREALLAADHNAYHIGQLIDVRRLLGAWKG
jgi:DinB family protein